MNDGYEDCEDGSDEYDDDGHDDYTFYCSNDGEDYAESMGESCTLKGQEQLRMSKWRILCVH